MKTQQQEVRSHNQVAAVYEPSHPDVRYAGLDAEEREALIAPKLAANHNQKFLTLFEVKTGLRAVTANTILLVACTAGLTLGAGLAQAQTESVIFNFDGPEFTTTGCSTNGGAGNLGPRSGLFFLNNRLFGTTPSGGTGILGEPDTKDGTAFSLTIPSSGDGQKTVLHSFINNGNIDGAYPCSRLIAGPSGAMYGTTLSGGLYGWGTIFRLTWNGAGHGWTETPIYSFKGGAWGGLPTDGLVRDSIGNLYGATSFGGAYNSGIIFILSPPAVGQEGGWQLNVLYDFGGGSDGYYPNGDLLLDASTGALFGTTLFGGTGGDGTAFMLTPRAVGFYGYTKTTLWNFSGSSPLYSAASPNGGLVGGTGALFGTTQNGGSSGTSGCCGTVFFLWQEYAGNPDYTLVILHQFADGTDGAEPSAGLLENPENTFWGTTTLGGTSGLGTVFELYPNLNLVENWHYRILHSFSGAPDDGTTPESPLTVDSAGTLYGTTNAGGLYNRGTVYEIMP
jgi:uncharacterized repeat protein (TIGR03803 family)